MKPLILLLLCLLTISNLQAQSLLQYVNPLIGTSGSTTISAIKHGEGTERLANTIPAVGGPFGMTQWTPQTQTTEQKCIAPYYYKDNMISGFRGTHWLSGSCTQDYGSFTIMPITGTLLTSAAAYGSPFKHSQEQSAPNYYKVLLDRSGIEAEITGLARSGMMRFTANSADSMYLLVTVNNAFSEGYISVDTSRQEISGFNPVHKIYQGWGKPAGFSGYFVIQIEKKFTSSGTFSENQRFVSTTILNKKGIGSFVGFRVEKGENIQLRIGTSFTSIEQARKNLETEIKDFDFEQVKKASGRLWEKQLSKVAVKSSKQSDLTIFYTALYHSMQQPRLYNDVSGTYPKFSLSYQTGKLLPGRKYFDDFSMWDIYRAQLPLMQILTPATVGEMVNSMVIKGNESGWLPTFPCWNSHTSAMIGDHAVPFITSSYVRGINNYSIVDAYRLMRKNAFEMAPPDEYIEGKGRRALSSYLRYQYVPLEDSVNEAFHKKEQVSRTLEYAYDDYALAILAKSLRKTEDYTILQKRGLYYMNVLDKTTGFVRGRYADGRWVVPFDPDKKADFITEGTSRQYTFYSPQDVPGLIKLMGGPPKFEASLDQLFGRGQYWHGNEPGHHIPFLYNYTTSPWKTQLRVNQILLEEYGTGPGGLSGNDDAGQLSAWYVFAAIGFYPVDPVSTVYEVTAPHFNDIWLNVSAKKQLHIVCHKESKTSVYISKITLNGKKIKNHRITYNQIMQGGLLNFYLSNNHN